MAVVIDDGGLFGIKAPPNPHYTRKRLWVGLIGRFGSWFLCSRGAKCFKIAEQCFMGDTSRGALCDLRGIMCVEGGCG